MSRQVPFIVAELGTDTDSFILHLYAALSEKERALISQRTSTLGEEGAGSGWGTQTISISPASQAGRVNGAVADHFAVRAGGVIDELRGQGLTLRAVADRLNLLRVPTARGGGWHAATVRNAILRRSPRP